MDDQKPGSFDELLQWCAILRRCDDLTLHDLAGAGQGRVAALLRRGLLLPLAGAARGYTLHDRVRRAMLNRIRQRHARDEIDLHARALRYFTNRLQPAPTRIEPLSLEEDEAELLYHLGALVDLFIEYMEWESIISYTSVVHNTPIVAPRLAIWLEFYEDYASLRSGSGVGVRERIERHLLRPDLEPMLRLRMLHACHIAYIELSRYDHALALLQEALFIAQALGEAARESYLLLSIGQIYNDLEDHQRALMYSEQSLQLARASGALYREAHALYEVGSNAMQLGQWERALAALDGAEMIYRRIGMPRRLAMILWAQGMAHQINGNLAACEQAYQSGLAISLAPDHRYPVVAMDILKQLGLLYQVQGRADQALEIFDRAITLAAQHDLRHWQPILLATRARVLQQQGRIAEAAAAYRAAISGVEAIRSGIEIEAMQISLFGTTQYIYDSFVLFCREHEPHAVAFAYVEQARARAFLDQLARHSPELYSAADQPTVTLAEVQARLGEGELLLEYYTTGLLPRADHWLSRIPRHNRQLRAAVIPKPEIILFAITRDTIEVYPIAVDPNTLYPSRHSEDPVLDMLRIDAVARWLYDRLLAPVAHLLAASRLVYLIPHGPLHYIPFNALCDNTGRYLLDAGGPAIAHAPSATILLRNCLSRPPSRATRHLAIGYNGHDDQLLEHAELESQLVARMVGGEAWADAAPKSQRLIAIGDELRWLHIAGHAIYNRQIAHTFGLRLGADDILDVATIMGELKLSADVVILSSCMSGFGRVDSGDELFGLQRAFLYTGTPTVVCTLAKTRDTVAMLVMEQFYTYLGQGMTAAQALRDALVAVRRMRRDEVNLALLRFGYGALPAAHDNDCPFDAPEYWAAFVLIGRP